MGDFIIKSGDSLQVVIPLPAVVVELALPVPLVGSGTDVRVDDTPVCLLGDELPAALAGLLVYTVPPEFDIPGTGTLTLSKPNVTAKTLSGGKPILIKGQFSATFNVVTPAFFGEVPDPDLEKVGIATFITTDTTVTAS
jgi:hypothetical protein